MVSFQETSTIQNDFVPNTIKHCHHQSDHEGIFSWGKVHSYYKNSKQHKEH